MSTEKRRGKDRGENEEKGRDEVEEDVGDPVGGKRRVYGSRES